MKNRNSGKAPLMFHSYIILWCIYGLQGVLYSSGEWLSRSVLFVILLVSLYYFIYANIKYKLPDVLKVLTVLVFVFSIYGIIRILLNEQIIITEDLFVVVSPFDYLKKIMMSLLPAYTIYVMVKEGGVSEKALRFWTIIFLIVSISEFYMSHYLALTIAQQSGSMREEFTNSTAYEILSIAILIPLFSKRPLLQYIILGVCLYYVLIGMKRGVWLCGAATILWFLYNSLRTPKNSNKVIWMWLLTMAIIIGVFYLINYLLQSSDWFNSRLEATLAGDSSNREDIFQTFLNHFLNESNVFLFLFGNGADATITIFRNYAHNDWLEIAINNGAFLLVLYFVYWIFLFQTARKAKKNNTCFMIISLYFIFYLLKSFFSMSYADVSIFASVALGYALATNQSQTIDIEKLLKNR